MNQKKFDEARQRHTVCLRAHRFGSWLMKFRLTRALGFRLCLAAFQVADRAYHDTLAAFIERTSTTA